MEIEINFYGVQGKLYKIPSNGWNFECGGFYGWNAPFDEALFKAKRRMFEIATLRANKEIKRIHKEKNDLDVKVNHGG